MYVSKHSNVGRKLQMLFTKGARNGIFFAEICFANNIFASFRGLVAFNQT